MSYTLHTEGVTAQISSACRPVFYRLSDAVLLPSPHPRGKDLFLPVISQRWHYLLSFSADAMQNDSPKSSVPLPDNSAGGP